MKIIAVALIVLLTSITAYAQSYEERRANLREEIQLAVAVYRESGIEAGIARLQELFDEQVAISRQNERPFRSAVWDEAQTMSGRLDDAWSEALYVWIFQTSTGGDFSGKTSPHGDNLVVTSILIQCWDQGKLAESRKWTEYQKRLSFHNGIDLNMNRYADLGPLFSWIPEARNRDFLISAIEKNPNRKRDSIRVIPYWHMSGIESVMIQAYKEGDWRTAAEMAEWLRVLVRKDESINEREGHIFHETRAYHHFGNEMLARIADLHGYYDQAQSLRMESVDEYPSFYYANHTGVKVDLTIARARAGESSEADLEFIRKIIDKAETGKHRKYISLGTVGDRYRAQVEVLHSLGREDEAFSLLDGIFEKFPGQEGYNLRLEIDLHIDHGLAPDWLEDQFVQLLEIYRTRGLKIKEPGLYQQYARYHALRGDYSTAIELLKESLRLFRALRIQTREAETLALLAEYYSAMGRVQESQGVRQTLVNLLAEWNRPLPSGIRLVADSSPPEPAPDSGISIRAVDLQPISMTSFGTDKTNASGRFYLSNTTYLSVPGEIVISGKVTEVGFDADVGNLWIGVDTDAESNKNSIPVELPPGAQYLIQIEALSSSSLETVKLEWQENGETLQRASWNFSLGDQGFPTSVLNASLLEENSFYLVPIYHSVQLKGAKVEDFRVVPDFPARIEVYSGETGELLYIDANGDGDLRDSGDILAVDRNQNGLPDIAPSTDRFAEIEIFVNGPPSATREKNEFGVEIQLREANEWQTHARNLIREPSS